MFQNRHYARWPSRASEIRPTLTLAGSRTQKTTFKNNGSLQFTETATVGQCRLGSDYCGDLRGAISDRLCGSGNRTAEANGKEVSLGRGLICHLLQPLPSGTICYRVHGGSLEDHHDSHARAGQHPGGSSKGAPEVSPTRQRTVRRQRNYANESSY
jgi:hypothetical protein